MNEQVYKEKQQEEGEPKDDDQDIFSLFSKIKEGVFYNVVEYVGVSIETFKQKELK